MVPNPRFSTTVEISVQKGYGAASRALPSRAQSCNLLIIEEFVLLPPVAAAARGTGSMSDTLWDDVLARVEGKVNRHSFATWFRPTTYLSLDGVHAAHRGAERPVPGVAEQELPRRPPGGPRRGSASRRSGSPSRRSPRRRPRAAAAAPAERDSSPLNPKYTFESFVVGSSNQFAHAAARAVAEIPSKSYNPLFIYGGVGLGKTHLMHAIGHYILARQKRLNVLYISTDRFINEMINAIRFDRLPVLPPEVPRDRRAAHRRHPVHRRQGPHPGGVLPHLQRAARRAEADRGELATARPARSRPSRSASTAASSGA